MIKLDDYIEQLTDYSFEHRREYEEKQKELFLSYVLRNQMHLSFREKIKEEFDAGKRLFGQKGLRKKLGAIDLEYFKRAYLSHYFSRKSPDFHSELDEIWTSGVCKGKNVFSEAEQINKKEGVRKAIAAPRGHAKSTNLTFADSIHAAAYQYKHYILILSDSSDQAEGFLSDIRAEFEDNAALREDFGELKGEKVWKNNVLLTSTNIKIEAIGSGKKIRGRKHRNWRPDLILLDDIENDENVNTPEQRRKLMNWYYKAVSKAGDTYTDIVYIGTLLHYDSLLAKVLKNPEYDAVKYKGVIAFSSSSLWDDWEKIYTDLTNEMRKEDAQDFFEKHKEEMLEGTEVLWEEKLSYYKLMVIRVSEGTASFNSEIQNEPIDPDSATFNEEWFDFYNEEEMDFSASEFILIGANDPSLGKNKKSDTSAIITIAKSLKDGYLYIVDASIEKRKADQIIDDVIETHRRYKREFKKGFKTFGVESNQFQFFFKEVMAQKSAVQQEYLPLEEIYSTSNKQARIESLQPFVKNRYLKFNRKHKTLLQQMTEYPMSANDDGPDALQMCVALALKTKGNSVTEYKSVISRMIKFKKGAY